jgi:tight adherence protein C
VTGVVRNPPFAVGVLGGALAGLGLFLAVREALPGMPALAPALRRLHPGGRDTVAGGPRARSLDRLGGVSRYLSPPGRELALLNQTPERYTLSLLVSGAIGIALPGVLSAVLLLAGVVIPFTIPLLAGVLLGALGVFLAHRSVIGQAERARAEFSRAVCTYLDLVALQMSAAHGPVHALERAASVCDGWVFERIREALRMAQMQMHAPWDELRALAEVIGVPELGDVGAIMQSSGTEGAAVQETLRSRADSLRDQIRTDNLAKAESVTSRLDIPGALLVFVLMGFVIYPFATRI